MTNNEILNNKQKVLNEVVFINENIGYIPLLNGIVNHGFSWGKKAGNMSFSYGEKQETKDRINAFLNKLKMPSIESTVNIAAEHGEIITDITEEILESTQNTNIGRSLKCDAMFTKIINLPLTIKPADCTVSIIYGVSGIGENILGLVHAGRRGLDLQLPYKAIGHMIDKYKCDIKSIKIGITPTITIQNHFIRNISELNYPEHWNGFTRERDGLIYLDFIGQILSQYSSIGLTSDQVQLYNVDTYEAAKDGETFSHRYWQMNPTYTKGRMLVAAQLNS